MISLLPEVQGAWEQGFTVKWEDRPARSFNSADYHFFWVGVETTSASAKIGSYAVNKYTADVWSVTLVERVSSPEVEEAQRLIRRIHGISARVLSAYRERPLYTDQD